MTTASEKGDSVRLLIAALLPLCVVGSACAQLPVATGRELALSEPQWKLFVPNDYTHRGDVDLLVHFHGDPQTVWNNAAYAKLNAVVVTVNYSGLSSAYSNPFSDATLFQRLLDDALGRLAGQADFGRGADWGRLAVSSFSAGYGAVRQILSTQAYFGEIDSLLAADSLYATTAADGTPLDSQMADYKAFATSAAGGDKTFVFTHSQVPTFTYESTAETGAELLQHLGLSARGSRASGLGTLQFYRHAQQDGFALWGATGSDGDAHLEHLRYIGEWLDDLGLDDHSRDAANKAGDYNADGVTDAADYTVWRDHLNQPTDLGDGDNNGLVDTADYLVWRSRYAGAPTGVANPVPAESSSRCVVVSWALLAFRRRR
ncbi:hypothetical protein Pla123a_25740 [Posidoniimonas polymericola]|uniref:Uncharacterized protein n=1 Tax=Posidoniimonas polymericola TaxID=2528002 RepID=A0A5C5YQK2_9BACT|nr:hypothetical protein [Posidoniimonas polymericola]TWT77143.1 hypothetical protein Pla123a_25740 [Posidoniimonas polymericola]